MLMMMMLDYGYHPFSHKDNYYTLISSSYVFIGDDGRVDIYIYIYMYMGTICSSYYMMVCVGIDDRVSTSRSQYCMFRIVCRVASYLHRIMNTRSFEVAVHLLVVVLIDDC